jgi:hypothetical protein
VPLVSRTFEIGLTVDMIIDLLVAWLLPAMGKKSLLAIIGASGKPEGTVQVDLSFMIGPLSFLKIMNLIRLRSMRVIRVPASRCDSRQGLHL